MVMNPKVLLINPPFKYLMTAQILPLGLLNLGTILQKEGFDVHIIDFNAEKENEFKVLPNVLSQGEFLQKFKQYDPDIVGITSCTENYPIALQIARMCKDENPNLKLVFGGPHVTFETKECLSNNPFIDLVAVGEIEHVIVNIINGLLQKLELNKIQNISYRKNNTIEEASFYTVPDLNKIPPPDLSLIKGKYYPSHLLHIEFSRGCPYRCRFCSLSPLSNKQVRYFPIARILECLQSFETHFKSFHFFVTDPTFLLNYDHVRRFLKEIKANKISLPEWDFQTRVNLLNREILRELKEANAYEITLGIEDIHDSVLQKIGKNQTFNQIEDGLKIIKEIQLKSHSNFIMGLPSQTREQAIETITYASNLDRFNFSVIKPFPGTYLFNHPQEFGMTILTTNWEQYITYEIVMNSSVFPMDAQREVRELAVQHYARVHIERDLFDIYDLVEHKYLLKVGFDMWYEQWKKEHDSGWN
jgi:anaerobic magnesium-protoporphyrin IX monomethyl ester cyclase